MPIIFEKDGIAVQDPRRLKGLTPSSSSSSTRTNSSSSSAASTCSSTSLAAMCAAAATRQQQQQQQQQQRCRHGHGHRARSSKNGNSIFLGCSIALAAIVQIWFLHHNHHSTYTHPHTYPMMRRGAVVSTTIFGMSPAPLEQDQVGQEEVPDDAAIILSTLLTESPNHRDTRDATQSERFVGSTSSTNNQNATSPEAASLTAASSSFSSLSPSSSSSSSASASASASSPYAYAFVIGGCKPPHDDKYRGFLYNILVTTRVLRQFGSTADVVALIQLSNSTDQMTLPDMDVHPLQALGVRIHYLPKPIDESFYDTVMNKFRILTLTNYRRVLLLDGDVMPIGNLDYFFAMSDGPHAVLRENVVVNGPYEPANGGFFMLEPSTQRYQELTEIIHRREQLAKHLPFDREQGRFNRTLGWGHIITPPDHWVARRKKGIDWSFHFGYSDQGLLYHYVKYHQKSVSLIQADRIENWYVSSNETEMVDAPVRLQETLHDAFVHVSKPILNSTKACRKFLCDFVHFSGNGKPWLKSKPVELLHSNTTRLDSAYHLWWHTIRDLDHELSLNLNYTHWKRQGPPLGYWATPKSVDRRAHAQSTSNQNTAP